MYETEYNYRLLKNVFLIISEAEKIDMNEYILLITNVSTNTDM